MRDYEKLKEQDKRDVYAMALANSPFLHYSTKTNSCKDPLTCLLCMEAARLAVQWYRPVIEYRVVSDIMNMYNIKCTSPHPGSDD